MNVIETAEKECAVLGSLFQGIVNEMKVSVHRTSSRNPIEQIRRRKKKSHRLERRVWRPSNAKDSIITTTIIIIILFTLDGYSRYNSS